MTNEPITGFDLRKLGFKLIDDEWMLDKGGIEYYVRNDIVFIAVNPGAWDSTPLKHIVLVSDLINLITILSGEQVIITDN